MRTTYDFILSKIPKGTASKITQHYTRESGSLKWMRTTWCQYFINSLICGPRCKFFSHNPLSSMKTTERPLQRKLCGDPAPIWRKAVIATAELSRLAEKTKIKRKIKINTFIEINTLWGQFILILLIKRKEEDDDKEEDTWQNSIKRKMTHFTRINSTLFSKGCNIITINNNVLCSFLYQNE